MKKVQFDNFIRDLLRERQLKRRIAHLRNCRSNGLTKLSGQHKQPRPPLLSRFLNIQINASLIKSH